VTIPLAAFEAGRARALNVNKCNGSRDKETAGAVVGSDRLGQRMKHRSRDQGGSSKRWRHRFASRRSERYGAAKHRRADTGN
jgi:hypothetical protein